MGKERHFRTYDSIRRLPHNNYEKLMHGLPHSPTGIRLQPLHLEFILGQAIAPARAQNLTGLAARLLDAQSRHPVPRW